MYRIFELQKFTDFNSDAMKQFLYKMLTYIILTKSSAWAITKQNKLQLSSACQKWIGKAAILFSLLWQGNLVPRSLVDEDFGIVHKRSGNEINEKEVFLRSSDISVTFRDPSCKICRVMFSHKALRRYFIRDTCLSLCSEPHARRWRVCRWAAGNLPIYEL